MEETIIIKISVKASEANPLVKPPLRHKPLNLRQIYAYMPYKTMMILKKDNNKKSLSSMTKSL